MSNRSLFWHAVRRDYGEVMRRFRPLPTEEQRRLVDSLPDEEAREMLILSNLRIAFKAASRYHVDHLAPEDLMQTAVTALTEAIDTYDPDAGALVSWIVTKVRNTCWRLVYADQEAEREGFEIASLHFGDDRQLVERVAVEEHEIWPEPRLLSKVEKDAIETVRQASDQDRMLASLVFGIDFGAPGLRELIESRWPSWSKAPRGSVPRLSIAQAAALVGIPARTAQKRISQLLSRARIAEEQPFLDFPDANPR